MSLKSKESHSKKLVPFLAIVGRIDSKTKRLAQKLDENRCVYHAYAVLDSLNSSYSMFKYFFDVFFSKNNPNLMYEVLTSTEGIAIVAAEVGFLVPFALLASFFGGKKKKNYKGSFKGKLDQHVITFSWFCLRDVMKALRAGYKGCRNIVLIINVIGLMDFKYLIVPFGLGLGVLVAAIRIIMRFVQKRRYEQIRNNEAFLKHYVTRFSFDNKSHQISYDNKFDAFSIQFQSRAERACLFLVVAVDGFADGAYYLIGVVGLSVFVPPLFIAMVVISTMYLFAHIIYRIHAEYNAQLELKITKTKCELACMAEEMKKSYIELLLRQIKQDNQTQDLEQIRALKNKLPQLIQNVDALNQLLKRQTKSGYLAAGLRGMNDGLVSYQVLTTILFMVSSVCFVTTTVFPPVLLAVFIISGLILMAMFVAFSLTSHYSQQRREEADKTDPDYSQSLDLFRSSIAEENFFVDTMRASLCTGMHASARCSVPPRIAHSTTSLKRDLVQKNIEEQENKAILAQDSFKNYLECIKKSLTDEGDKVKSTLSLRSFYLNSIDVLCSLASAIPKGNNFFNFIRTLFQDNFNEYSVNAPIKSALGIFFVVVFAVVYALRAFARGFGHLSLWRAKPPPPGPEILSLSHKVLIDPEIVNVDKPNLNVTNNLLTDDKKIRIFGEDKFGDKKRVNFPTENKTAHSAPSLIKTTTNFFFSHSNTISQSGAVVDLVLDHCTF